MKAVFIRGVDEWTAEVFAINAAARGLRHGAYLAALVALHTDAKEKARDADQANIGELLDELGLGEVVA